jgi:hypothetical protein
MKRRVATAWLGSCLLLTCNAYPAAAQGEPAVGVRATGMGGAFTAVADDASAAVWNPAALASGSLFSAVLNRNSLNDGGSTIFAGVALPAFALFYDRVATGSAINGRNTLVAQDLGVSLVQSIGYSGVAVGTTVKWVRGETGSGSAVKARNTFDADVGVVVVGALMRAGLTVHNLRRPGFDAADGSVVHRDRDVRGGAAIQVRQDTVVAADVEFTKAALAAKNGESPHFWRDAAIGVENTPILSVRLRAGVHWNTAGGVGKAPTASFGGSYVIRGALMADGQISVGSKDGTRGWGAGLRFVF